MLFIRDLKPNLNVQSDSICAKVFFFIIFAPVSYVDSSPQNRFKCCNLHDLKVPLTPKFFISRRKSPFCSDHIGEKIIVVRFFLDFLWIFKLRKIRTTVVHHRVTRRMGRVWCVTSAGEAISLGEMMREWKDSRSEVTEGLFSGKNLLQCLIGVLLRIAVMWWICVSVHNIPFFGD